MTNYELCKHYIEENENIINCVGESTDEFCIAESIKLLDEIINKIDIGKLSMIAGTKFIESYCSIGVLYINHIIDNDEHDTLLLQLLDQIIVDMEIYVKYKDSMKEGEQNNVIV